MPDEKDAKEILRLAAEVDAAMHAMQSAVALKMQMGEEGARETQPKHLRVGINSAMITDFAVGKLLISKGIITELEYAQAVRDAAVAELESYKAWFRERGLSCDFA